MAALTCGLEAVPGVTVYGPSDPARRGGVVSFNLSGWDPVDVATVLDQSFGVCSRPGLHCCPGAHRVIGTFPSGTVRLGPGCFNTGADVEAVVGAIKSLASI